MKWKNIAYGVRLAWDASPRRFVATVAVSIVSALLAALELWIGKHLIDLVVAGKQQHVELVTLAPTAVCLGIVFGADRTLSILRDNMQQVFSRSVDIDTMRRFVEKAASVDLGYFDDPEWHDRMDRARRDVGWRSAQMSFTTIDLARSLVNVVGMMGLLATLHPLLILLALLPVVPWTAIQRRVNRDIHAYHLQLSPQERERLYIAELLARGDHAKEIRATGVADHLLGRYKAFADDSLSRMVRLYRRAQLFAVVAGIATAAALSVAYFFLASQGLAGVLSAGGLTAAIGAMAAITTHVSVFSQSILMIEQHATFLEDYFAFLRTEPLVTRAAAPAPLSSPLREGIALQGVRFKYPGSSREVLTGLDLEVRPGQLVAIVGDNGAGKSTIVNLLLRFYDPAAGRICFDGVELTQLDLAELRSRVGVLFQDFTRYQFSLRENVQLGRVDRKYDDADILASLEAAHANQILPTLAKGLDSRLGRMFDGGNEISGGQWQRVALARLMFRSADLWILDEPTSNLHPEAEAAIFSELKQQLAGRMAIVISHRFSTVRAADRIYVVEGGRVIESGPHDQLMAINGRYAALFQLQAAGYR